MKKLYKKLTDDQKKRGVIFSSTLSYNRDDIAPLGLTGSLHMHEVFAADPDHKKVIERLLDDKFFNNSSYKFNIIRK